MFIAVTNFDGIDQMINVEYIKSIQYLEDDEGKEIGAQIELTDGTVFCVTNPYREFEAHMVRMGLCTYIPARIIRTGGKIGSNS